MTVQQSAIPEPSMERIRYDQPQQYVRLNESLGSEERIRELAATLQADTPERTLDAIGRWIQAHFEYDSRVDAQWRNFDTALDTRLLGSCADHAVVFAALTRACGVPTVFVKCMDADWIREFCATGSCKSWRGHVFLEVFLGGGWRLLDAQAMHLYDEYDPAMRGFPGNRYAYDKGADPRELILSLDRERWVQQTAAYFREFDLSRLSAGEEPALEGRFLVKPVYVAGNSPVFQAVCQRLQELGCRSVFSFNCEFEKYLAEAAGGDLILTCVGDLVVLPEAFRERFLPIALGEIGERQRREASGVARKQLEDGTRIALIYGRDLTAIQEAIRGFDLSPAGSARG